MPEKVRLTGAQQTLFGPLFARAKDSQRTAPILGDTTAWRLVRQLDPELRRFRLDTGDSMAVLLRARTLDGWTRRFLAAHPDAVVLHLACGLDIRALRLDLPSSVDWFDVDLPDVIGLRQRLFPPINGNYRTIGGSVTETGWLDEVPTGRPTLVIAEGLLMYLDEPEVYTLLRRLVKRFGSGELLFARC